MEPNKMEKDFKKKLEQRAIKPSDMAWDRLDAMLSVAEEKKKPNRTWLFVAASFLGFLLIGTLFFKQEKTNGAIDNKDNNTVVSSENPVNNADMQKIVTEETKTPVQYTDAQETALAAGRSKKEVRRNVKATQKVNVPEVKNETLLINEAVADNNVQQEPVNKTGMEPETLLAESFDKAVAKKSKVKVDPNSLLSGVEGELNENYRGNVWQTVTKNYTAVKTTLANRNRE